MAPDPTSAAVPGSPSDAEVLRDALVRLRLFLDDAVNGPDPLVSRPLLANFRDAWPAVRGGVHHRGPGDRVRQLLHSVVGSWLDWTCTWTESCGSAPSRRSPHTWGRSAPAPQRAPSSLLGKHHPREP